jgi:hypothetical protein
MKPIIFSTSMVQAILREENPKTNTRRVIKPQPKLVGMTGWHKPILHIPGKGPLFPGNDDPKNVDVRWRFSPYKPGDALWVRESFADIPEASPGNLHYKADANKADLIWFKEEGWKWRPSIHMPREAARIFLRVTDVRVERLLDITETDAMREGFEVKIKSKTVNGNVYNGSTTAREGFLLYWDDLYAYKDVPKGEIFGPKASHKNPWVWVYAFRRITREEACDE